MDTELTLNAELVASFALYMQIMVDGTPSVQEVARLTHSEFYAFMKTCKESLDFLQGALDRHYGQALKDFWASQLEVAHSQLRVEYDGFCRPASEPFRW